MYIYTLGTNQPLESAVLNFFKAPRGHYEERVFSNGEYYLRLSQDVKKKKTVVLASVTDPEKQIFRLLFLANALKSNGASRTLLVLPYYPYSRQDRVDQPGAPISAELMASLYINAGFSKIITINIHNLRGLGKQRKNVINIDPTGMLCDFVKRQVDSSWVIVAPDAGAVKRALQFKKIIKAKYFVQLTKFRPKPGQAKILKITGDSVHDKKALIVDDMIDTGGTLIQAANFLGSLGAKQIAAVSTHGIFSDQALKNINRSIIKKIFVTDTLPVKKSESGKLTIIPIHGLIEKSLRKYV